MRQMLEREREVYGEEEQSNDLVLGAPALLGIFFALALVCAVCFGFGYSSGHGYHLTGESGSAMKKSAETNQAATQTETTPPPQDSAAPAQTTSQTTSQPDNTPTADEEPPDQAEPPAPITARSEKPTPGVDSAQSEYWPPSDTASVAKQAIPTPRVAPLQAPPQPRAAVPASRVTPEAQPRASATDAYPVATSRMPAAAGVPAAVASTQPGSAFAPIPSAGLMVQIAAVSRAADAETLATALRHDGFAAIVRTATGDKFFHVQVGPFASLPAAKAMRTRLADNGYNAFIKP